MINIIVLILLAHFVADFVCQSQKMASNKSKNIYWLLTHILVYTFVLFLFSTYVFAYFEYNVLYWWLWTLANGVLHFIVDYFTSKLNTYLWNKKEVHWFFVSIGFDQFIHYICLLLTYQYLILQHI